MEQAQTVPQQPPSSSSESSPSPLAPQPARGSAALCLGLLLACGLALLGLASINLQGLAPAAARLTHPRGAWAWNPALLAWGDGLLVAGVAWLLGRRWLACCGPRQLAAGGEALLLGLVGGQVLLALLTLGLGLLPRGLHAVRGLLFVVVLVEVLLWFVRGRPRALPNSGADQPPASFAAVASSAPAARFSRWAAACTWGRVALAALLAVPLGLSLLYTLTPAIESDELRYHLAAPALWLRMGQIAYVPHQAFFSMPMLAEMQFLLAMALHGAAEGAKFIHWLMLPVCMGLVVRLALVVAGVRGPDEGAARGPALAAGAAMALLPSVAIFAGWAFVDLFQCALVLGFALAGAQALRVAGESAAGASPLHGELPRWAALLGLMAAGGVGVKYTMLPLFGLLGLAWAVLLVRRVGPRAACWPMAVAALVALALGAPWLLRNLLWTGNPFYPLAWGLFGGGEWSAQNAAFYLAKAGEKGYRLGGDWPPAVARLLELLLTPWSTWRHFDLFESHYLGPLVPMALLLLPGGLWLCRRGAGEGDVRRPAGAGTWIKLCLLATWLLWFFSYQSNRMLVPTVALLFALAGGLLGRVWPRLLGAERALARVAFAAGGLASLAVYLLIMGSPDRVMTVHQALGFMRAEDYLARRVGYWSAAQWAARNLPRPGQPAPRLLLVGEHRTLYFDLPVEASDWFDTPQPLPWIRATATNDELWAAWRAAGVTHLFFNAGELALYHDAYFRPRFTAAEYERFRQLMADPRLQLVREFGDPRAPIRLYALPPGRAGSP